MACPPAKAAKYEFYEAYLKLWSLIHIPTPGDRGASIFFDVPGLIIPIGWINLSFF